MLSFLIDLKGSLGLRVVFAAFPEYFENILPFHESVRGIRIPKSEVKFLDFRKTHDCESIYQGCFR